MYRAAVLLCVGCFANGSLKHGAAYGVNAGAILISAFKMVRAPSLQSCDGLDNTPPPIIDPNIPYSTPYSVCRDHNNEHHDTYLYGSIAISAAIVGGLVNYFFFDGGPAETKDDDTLEPSEQTHDSLEVTMMEANTPSIPLMQLTRQAALAAREHHCKVVKVIAKRIRQMDDSYARTGFVNDAAIKACMEEGKPANTAEQKKPEAKPEAKPDDKGAEMPGGGETKQPTNEAAHGKQ
jgi:hypothetical protein